ncbi:LVIVD repeat-containing protein [Segetibacter aerophilus]|uniref:LVIVD repeat-containing protein n=1 Tax=Segetibacter aerophilus TaxID=670293 RepID=A0A512BAG7_9BACT|nr:hypothetical protein [Segetibacter aerophilus]GEO08956.1 hypothetical protein SAE01_14520 [Segetibacter aerophilus]
MKARLSICNLAVLLLTMTVAFNSCVKDTVSRTYSMYTPVYKTSAEVRANIKNDAPLPVKSPGKMFVLGNYIYLNEIDKGIHVIDNSNPANPVNKYFIAIPGNIDLAVTGTTLYADLYTDLVTIDISSPSSIVVKKITEGVFPFRRYSGNFVADNSKIITDWIKKDTTVTTDLDTHSNTGVLYFDAMALSSISPSASNKAAIGISGSMARFTLLNNYLYTVTENALNVFNISQPQNPVFSNKINLPFGIETIYPFKSNLFIGSQTGMLIYGIANPAQPLQAGSFSHVRVCDPVIAEDNYAFVTLSSGTRCGGFTNQLDVVNIQDIQNPKLVKSYPLTNPHGLSKDGNTLFICDGSAGLKVFDATDVNNIKLLQTIAGMETYDIITVNGLAMVVAKDGLYEFDYSDKNKVQQISKISYNK